MKYKVVPTQSIITVKDAVDAGLWIGYKPDNGPLHVLHQIGNQDVYGFLCGNGFPAFVSYGKWAAVDEALRLGRKVYAATTIRELEEVFE